MSRYIDADELLDRVEWANTNPLIDHGETAVKLIKAMPTIDAEPIKHGRWIRKESKQCYWFECSECGYPPPLDKFKREWFSGYCPNCGARIDEVKE